MAIRTTPKFLTLSGTSRYKDTDVFDEAGDLEFGLWEPPAEFLDQPQGSLIHRVRQHEVGFLDIIAVKYYGAGYESLWPAIATANSIIDPEQEMYPGMALIIPPRPRVAQFIARAGDAV